MFESHLTYFEACKKEILNKYNKGIITRHEAVKELKEVHELTKRKQEEALEELFMEIINKSNTNR